MKIRTRTINLSPDNFLTCHGTEEQIQPMFHSHFDLLRKERIPYKNNIEQINFCLSFYYINIFRAKKSVQFFWYPA